MVCYIPRQPALLQASLLRQLLQPGKSTHSCNASVEILKKTKSLPSSYLLFLHKISHLTGFVHLTVRQCQLFFSVASNSSERFELESKSLRWSFPIGIFGFLICPFFLQQRNSVFEFVLICPEKGPAAVASTRLRRMKRYAMNEVQS